MVEDVPPTDSLCQARCANTTGCAGFTLSASVCQLRASLQCEPSYGLVRDIASTSELLGPWAIGGPPVGCVNNSAVAAGKPVDPWYTACDTPRCDTPVTNGYFHADGTFAPDACHYAYLDRDEALELLRGKWVAVTGGSNTLLLGQALANYLHGPVTFDTEPSSSGNLFGAFKDAGLLASIMSDELLASYLKTTRNSNMDLADFVWERSDSDGKYRLVHMHTSMWADLENEPGMLNGSWTDSRQAALIAQLGRAPTFNALASVRLTVVLSQYLPSSQRVLHAVAVASHGWDSASVVFSVQNGAWYIICGIKNEDACNREAIRGSDADALIATYLAELNSFSVAAQSPCESSRFTCFFATDAYVGNMGALAPVAMEAVAQIPWILAIDYYTLGSYKPDEILKGHGSTYLKLLWAQLMLNTLLPPSDGAPSCAQQLIASDACFGSSLRDPVCGEPCACTAWDTACEAGPYFGWGQCQGQAWDRPWECANERSCTMVGLLHASLPLTSNARNATDNVNSGSCDIDLVAELSSPTTTVDKPCSLSRLWCDSKTWAWGMAGLSLMSVGVLLSFYWYKWAHAQREPWSSLSARFGYWRNTSNNKGPPKGEQLSGLNAARLLASIHIVIGHLYAKGATDDVYLFGWGFTWGASAIRAPVAHTS